MTGDGRTVLEVQGADGEWHRVSAEPVGFTFDTAEPEPTPMSTRRFWTLETRLQPPRPPAWLRHPYRIPGVHHGLG